MLEKKKQFLRKTNLIGLCRPSSNHFSEKYQFHETCRLTFSQLKPIVGAALTYWSNFKRYSTVVFPAVSSPTIAQWYVVKPGMLSVICNRCSLPMIWPIFCSCFANLWLTTEQFFQCFSPSELYHFFPERKALLSNQ